MEEIRAGDTVVAQPGEWHWHGGGPQTFMTHLALQEAEADGSEVSWDVHVGEAEYLAEPGVERAGPST